MSASVKGTSGGAGAAVVPDLPEHGHQVTDIDAAEPRPA
jgi:hypothetical protein